MYSLTDSGGQKSKIFLTGLHFFWKPKVSIQVLFDLFPVLERARTPWLSALLHSDLRFCCHIPVSDPDLLSLSNK